MAWTLIQYDECPYKTRQLGHRHAWRGRHIKTQGEDGHPRARGLETGPSLLAFRRSQICQHLYLGF